MTWVAWREGSLLTHLVNVILSSGSTACRCAQDTAAPLGAGAGPADLARWRCFDNSCRGDLVRKPAAMRSGKPGNCHFPLLASPGESISQGKTCCMHFLRPSAASRGFWMAARQQRLLGKQQVVATQACRPGRTIAHRTIAAACFFVLFLQTQAAARAAARPP